MKNKLHHKMITNNLILAQPNLQDFQRFFEIHANPENNLYNPHGAMSHSIAEVVFKRMLKHWDDYQFGSWKISESNNEGFVVGFGGLAYRLYGEERKLNLGFRLDKPYWNKGYATEIASRSLAYGFDVLNKKEIFGLVRPANLASIRVLEKCAMVCIDKLADVPNEEESLVYRIEM